MSHSASLLPRINKSSVLRSLYHHHDENDDEDGDEDEDDECEDNYDEERLKC